MHEQDRAVYAKAFNSKQYTMLHNLILAVKIALNVLMSCSKCIEVTTEAIRKT